MNPNYTDLNHWSSLLDMLLYLENRKVLNLNRDTLKNNSKNLRGYIEGLIGDWKKAQEQEYRELTKD